MKLKKTDIDDILAAVTIAKEEWEKDTGFFKDMWQQAKQDVQKEPPQSFIDNNSKWREYFKLSWAEKGSRNFAHKLVNILFPDNAFMSVNIPNAGNKDVAEAQEKFIINFLGDQYTNRYSRFFKNQCRAIKAGATFGTLAVYSYFLNKVGTKSLRRFAVIDGEVQEKEAEPEKVTKYSGVVHEVIDLEKLIISPVYADDIADCTKIYETEESYSSLLDEGEEMFNNYQELLKIGKENSFKTNNVIPHVNLKKCFFPLFKFRTNPELVRNLFVVVADDRYIIHYEEYEFDFDPFQVQELIPNVTLDNPNCVYGVGIPFLISKELAYASANLSLGLDLIKTQIPITIGSGLDPNIKFEPGMFIDAPPDTVQVLSLGGDNPAIHQAYGEFKMEANENIGAFSITTPTSNGLVDGNTLATPMNIVQEENKDEFRVIARHISDYFVEPLIEKELTMISNFADLEYIHKKIDELFIVETEKDEVLKETLKDLALSGELFDVNIKIDIIEKTVLNKEKLANWYGNVKLFAETGLINQFSPERLAKMGLAYSGLPDDLLLKPDEKSAQEQQAAQQAQIQAQQTQQMIESDLKVANLQAQARLQVAQLQEETKRLNAALKAETDLTLNEEDNETILIKAGLDKVDFTTNEVDTSINKKGEKQ